MAELVYNGVTLSFISTQRVRFDPVMDDLSGVDYLYTKIVIDCVAVIGSVPSASGPQIPPFDATADTNPADTVRRVSHLLNTPRRGLTYKVGGRTLVSVVEPGGNTTIPLRDVENGPYTQAAVDRIIGTESIRVSFHVEAHVVDCAEATGTPPSYLSYRWSETSDVNELAMTTRTRTGRLVVRADMLANADELRGLVTPPLEKEFIRTSAQYTLQSDGRVLAYHFVDEEQYLMPPPPAARAEGRFTITCKDGASYYAECYLRLIGGKPTDKATLMTRACAIALAKIQSANPANKNGAFPLYGSLSENMFANDVSVHLTAQILPAKKRITGEMTGAGTAQGGNISGTGLPNPAAIGSPAPARPDGKKPGISSTENLDWLKVPSNWAAQGDGRFNPGTRGSAQLLLVAAQLQDPCLRLAVLTSGAQRTNQLVTDGALVPAQITITSAVPDADDSFRTTEDTGVYSFYDVTMKQEIDNYTMSLPVGKKDADAAVIQVAAPTIRMIVEWRAEKIGDKPKIPNPKLKDTNWTLVRDQKAPEQVEPVADGSELRYVIAGNYQYVGKSASKAKITAPVPPWVDVTAAPFANKPFEYADGILEPGTPSQPSLSTGGAP
jgi:hypothetical protein